MDEKMKEAMQVVYETLSDEQKKKVDACKSADDLAELFGEWEIELPDELVGAVAGGSPIATPLGLPTPVQLVP